jgi:CRP/FNR family cyclic AMP-dependent transcriptional regulator
METLEPILREHRFLKGLAEDQIRVIVGCAKNVRFDPNQFLFREGEEASTFHLIRSGKIALEDFIPGRGVVQVETIVEGDVLGWSWLYPPHRRSNDARALEPVRAIVFDGACLRKKCEEDQALGYAIMKRLLYQVLQRLERIRMQRLDVFKVG